MRNKLEKKKADQEIQDHKKRAVGQAIETVKAYSKAALKDYPEPVRAGTAKGDPIGLSRKKLYAAHLNILYPHGLELRDIAKMAGVSASMLGVWRTNKHFMKAIADFGQSVGEGIVEMIEMYMAISLKDPDQRFKTDGLKPGDISNLSNMEAAEGLVNDRIFFLMPYTIHYE